MSDHGHDHGPEGHQHWDHMSGPVNSDLITGLLEAQQQALANGIIHLTSQLEDIQAQHARVTEMLSFRAHELALINEASY